MANHAGVSTQCSAAEATAATTATGATTATAATAATTAAPVVSSMSERGLVLESGFVLCKFGSSCGNKRKCSYVHPVSKVKTA